MTLKQYQIRCFYDFLNEKGIFNAYVHCKYAYNKAENRTKETFAEYFSRCRSESFVMDAFGWGKYNNVIAPLNWARIHKEWQQTCRKKTEEFKNRPSYSHHLK